MPRRTVKQAAPRTGRTSNRKLKRNVKHSEVTRSSGSLFGALLRFAAIYLVFVSIFMMWREMYVWVVEQDWLDLRQVDIVDNERISDEELIRFSGLELGTPIYDIDVKEIALQIEAHPWVSRAFVSRRLPDALYIKIEEHRPVGLLKLDRLYYINAEGTPFKIAPKNTVPNHVMIEAMQPADFEDPTAGARKVRQALALIDLYDKHPISTLAKLKLIRFRHNQFELVVGKNSTTLVIGRNEPQQALDRASKLIRHLNRKNKVPKEIHLDNRSQAERVSVQFEP